MKTGFSKFFGSMAKLVKSALAWIPAHPVAALIIGGIIVVAGIGVGIYLGTGGGGLGFPSSATGAPVDTEISSEDPEPEPEIDWDEVQQLTISIKDDRVFVNDVEFEGAEELRAFLDEIYDDGKIVQLDDAQSILATRDWVIEVLNDLNISYTQRAA